MHDRSRDIHAAFHRRRCSRRIITATAVMGFVFFLFSCAAITLYTIDMTYSPSHEPPRPATRLSDDITFTVAQFTDTRDIDDKAVVGKVIDASGKIIRVMPKYAPPADIVASGIRTYLTGIGYTVSDKSPVWNSESEPMDRDWGTVLVGGTIDKLSIICHKEVVKKRYEAHVKLSVFFASVEEARIFHRVSVETNPSLVHVQFSEDRLAEQINTALADAIERVMSKETVYQAISENVGKSN